MTTSNEDVPTLVPALYKSEINKKNSGELVSTTELKLNSKRNDSANKAVRDMIKGKSTLEQEEEQEKNMKRQNSPSKLKLNLKQAPKKRHHYFNKNKKPELFLDEYSEGESGSEFVVKLRDLNG